MPLLLMGPVAKTLVTPGAMRAIMVSVVAARVWGIASAAAQVDPALAKSLEAKGTTQMSLSAQQVEFAYPKDWRVISGGVGTLVTVEHRKAEAAISIEQEVRELDTRPSDVVDLFVELELEYLGQQNPGARDVQSRIVSVGEQRFVIVEFTRPGTTQPERVRVYVIPSGRRLFRIVCRSSVGSFDKYGAAFAHVAATFTAKPVS